MSEQKNQQKQPPKRATSGIFAILMALLLLILGQQGILPLGDTADGTDLLPEYEMVHITGRFEQKHIPVPDRDEIQVIIDLQLIFRDLLDRCGDLAQIHILDIF